MNLDLNNNDTHLFIVIAAILGGGIAIAVGVALCANLTAMPDASTILIVGSLLALYLLPAIIGYKRDVTGFSFLFSVNVFLGWTGVIWIVCLIWAAFGQTKAMKAFYAQALKG
jgi:hypothetical protein